MKKLISAIALFAVVTPAFSATKNARPSYLTRNANGGYNVTYSYTDKAKSGWYGAMHAELALLSWKNKYSTDMVPLDPANDHDEYSFEPKFTANMAFGKRINYFWRAEVEAGYIFEFVDKDDNVEYSFSAPYLIANGYYDFTNGLYVGAGLGIAMPITKLDAPGFTDSGNRTKYGISPMGALMFGYSYKLDDNLLLDLRYRFAGFWGTEQERELADIYYFKNKMGFVMDNSISVGIRYEF